MEEEARAEKVKRAAVQEMDAKKGRSMAALTALEDDLKKTVAAQRSYKIEQAQVTHIHTYTYMHILLTHTYGKMLCFIIASNLSKYQTLIEPVPYYRRPPYIHTTYILHTYIHTYIHTYM